MTVVNKEICRNLIAKDKWSKTLCLLCSVREYRKCENLKTIQGKEDRKFEETSTHFDERREHIHNEILVSETQTSS